MTRSEEDKFKVTKEGFCLHCNSSENVVLCKDITRVWYRWRICEGSPLFDTAFLDSGRNYRWECSSCGAEGEEPDSVDFE